MAVHHVRTSLNWSTLLALCALWHSPVSAQLASARPESATVLVPSGNGRLTKPLLASAQLELVTCFSETENCVYRIPRGCRDSTDEVARELSKNVYACRDTKSGPALPPRKVADFEVNVELYPVATKSSAFGFWLSRQNNFWPPSPQRPKDDRFPDQHGLRAMRALDAWARVQPGSPVTTAIIDSGVQLDHPDLMPQITSSTQFTCNGCGAQDPCTQHGTTMAGIVAAAKDNGGIIGTAWNTRLMPIRVSAQDSRTYEALVVEAVKHAVNNGARVLNFSYAGTEPTPRLKETLQRLNGQFLFVVPASDEACDDEGMSYPAAYSLRRMIVVRSHDANMNPSTTCPNVTVDIHARSDGAVAIPCRRVCPTSVACHAFGHSGDSNATAYVSGAVALLWSHHPDWTAQQIKDHLLDSAITERGLGKRLDLAAMMNSKHPPAPRSTER